MIDFLALATPFLENLTNTLEDRFPELELDLNYHTLSIEVTPHHIFLITLHHLLQQIWLSSPISGGHHFFYDPLTLQWQSTKQKTMTLQSILFQEIMDLKSS